MKSAMTSAEDVECLRHPWISHPDIMLIKQRTSFLKLKESLPIQVLTYEIKMTLKV
jgi:hypothetical protein